MPRRSLGDHSRVQGFALLVVLWSIVLLSLLATQITASGRQDAQLARNLVDAATTQAAADGAVSEAVFRLFSSNGRLPLVRHYVTAQKIALDVRAESLAGRVNPNTASAALLRALLAEMGVGAPRAASLSDAIQDWSTPGEQPRPHGAKAAAYRAAGLQYAPPGTRMRSLDELALVLGMTPDLLARLRPHLTVWWDGDPEPAVADPVVLAALHTLGMDEERTAEGNAPAGLVVDITAEATGPGGSRFMRHAVVATSPSAAQGRLWSRLEWNTLRP